MWSLQGCSCFLRDLHRKHADDAQLHMTGHPQPAARNVQEPDSPDLGRLSGRVSANSKSGLQHHSCAFSRDSMRDMHESVL